MPKEAIERSIDVLLQRIPEAFRNVVVRNYQKVGDYTLPQLTEGI